MINNNNNNNFLNNENNVNKSRFQNYYLQYLFLTINGNN